MFCFFKLTNIVVNKNNLLLFNELLKYYLGPIKTMKIVISLRHDEYS